MQADNPHLMPEVLKMFRRGFDTAAMAKMLKIHEADAERVLHTALAVERTTKELESEKEKGDGQEEGEGEGHS